MAAVDWSPKSKGLHTRGLGTKKKRNITKLGGAASIRVVDLRFFHHFMYPAVWNKTSQSKKQKRKNEMFTLQKVESHWWVVRKITNKIAAAFDSFLTCHQIWLPLSINRDRKNQSRLSILFLWWIQWPTHYISLDFSFSLSISACFVLFSPLKIAKTLVFSHRV